MRRPAVVQIVPPPTTMFLVSAAAAGSVTSPTRSLARWLGSHGGSVSSRVTLRPSAACGGGIGVFAADSLVAGEELASVPFAACMSYRDAYEADGDLGMAVRSKLRDDEAFGKASVGVAALLAYSHWAPGGEQERARWGEYLDSLPWAVASVVAADGAVAFERDAELRAADHQWRTLAAPPPQSLEESVARWRRLHVARARGYALGVQQLVDGRLPLEACWAALWLVESRAFNLAPFGGSSCVMVPFADCFNHPSASALAAYGATGQAFATATNRSGACMTWTADLDRRSVAVRAPHALPVASGDEIWNWYDGAGFGAGSLDEWARGEAAFTAQYGFSPWE